MRVLRYSVLRLFVPLAFILCFNSPLSGQSDAGVRAIASSPQSENSPTVLTEGISLDSKIVPGQVQSYSIELTANQYVHLEVEQERLDISVRLLSSQGKELERRENVAGNSGVALSYVAPSNGTYRVEIRLEPREGQTDDEGAKSYRVKLAQLRLAQPDDEKRIAAERANDAGDKLRVEGTGPSRHESLSHYENALALYAELNDQAGQADTLSNLGRTHFDLGETNQALQYWNRELALRHVLGNPQDEGDVLGSIATAYTRLGDRPKALEYFTQSLEKVRAAGDKINEGLVLGNMGQIYFGTGQVRKALEYFEQALPLERGVGNRAGESATLNNMGLVYAALGEPQQALDYARQSLQLAIAGGQLDGQAAILSSIASLYWQLGDWEQALENQKSAVELTKKSGNRTAGAMILNNMGTTYRGLGDLDSALKCHEEALPILRESGVPNEATALQNIGRVYRDKGDFQKSVDYYQQALKLFQARNSGRGIAQVFTDLGDASLKLGQTSQALEYYARALPVATTSGDRVLEANVRTGIARADMQEGKLEEAQKSLDSALATTETLRTAWVGADMRAFYSSTVRDRYQLQIELLMRQHREEEALEASERARARSLLELLNESHADIREGVDPVLLAQERSLETDLRLKAEQRVRSQNAATEKELEDLTVQYREVQSRIRANSPRYAALTQPQTLTVAEIQKQILDSDTLLLEYSLGEERSFLWAVTPDSLHTYELPSRSKVEESARLAYTEMSRNQTPGERMPAETVALSHLLLDPVASELAKKRLVVIADGALQYIPFAALPSPPKSAVPLVADHEIVSLPSASTLALLRRETEGRKPAPKVVMVLADPVFNRDDPRVAQSTDRGAAKVASNKNPKFQAPKAVAQNQSDLERSDPALLERSAKDTGFPTFDRLLASRREAESIVALAGKDNAGEALDFDSSRETATSEALGQYRIIHIATHGLLNSHNPELSGLVFSLVDRQGKPQNGYLEAQEIYNLKLNANLVVLSACQTALGKDVRGEGLIGLTRGFMYAGAPRVVASLWKVPDQATTELMQQFYRGILQQGLHPAAALRAAQFAMWKESRHSAPYFWAGFTLQGEWK